MTLSDALDALLHGDPAPLRDAIRTVPTTDPRSWVQIWSTTSLIYGNVCGALSIRQDGHTMPATIEHHAVYVTGGAPREAVLEACLPALRSALASPPTVEGHRASALALLETLATDPMRWDPAVALLRHHTDLPVDVTKGRVPVMVPSTLAAEVAALSVLADPLSTPERFRRHLRAGINSVSAPRRALSGWLLGLG